MDAINKVEYKVRDLGTRSVLLFPTRAQITREIKDVSLKPGANEITIVGLSPTVDEHSIKVEGSGSATITDIAVEVLPNRDVYEEIYPDSDLDSSQSEDEDLDQEKPPSKSKLLRDKERFMVKLKDDLARANEIVDNADNRLEILGAYGKTLDKKRNVNIEQSLSMYKQERERAFADRMSGTLSKRAVEDAIEIAKEELKQLHKIDNKEQSKSKKEKMKVQKTQAKKHLVRAKRLSERLREKERVLKERHCFWPKYCYTVRILLDVNVSTPSTSRRTSISSDIDFAEKAPSMTMDCDETRMCDLVLSYVTTSAYWSPSYDLQLSTTNATASMCFDARLNNSTSETWKNCKITLSTSQATFAGLEDAVPILAPWHIKLATKGKDAPESDILASSEEQKQREDFKNHQKVVSFPAKPRYEMFGFGEGDKFGGGPPGGNHALADYQMQLMLLEQQNKKRLSMARQEVSPAPQGFQNFQAQQPRMSKDQLQVQLRQQMAAQHQAMQQQAIQQQAMQQQQHTQLSMQQAQQQQMQQMRPIQQPQQMQQMQMMPHLNQIPQQAQQNTQMGMPALPMNSSQPPSFGVVDGVEGFEDSGNLLSEPEPALDFEDSLIEETGFTTTYDLPGHKTLVPKSTASKQRVARINFSNVVFSHTIVAKYQPVAHLKARLRNSSKLTLLKGTASLTLDGSFMGRTTIPRCSSGDAFSLSLGVDPAIRVIYPKPDVHRTTTGMFTKEDSSVYVRNVTVQNTRASAGKAVKLLVLDQIPVSDDERLRVELLAPRGLSLGGPPMPAGESLLDSKDDTKWGKATATLKKGGEVHWDVNLNAGKAVKLGLEYVVAVPSGDAAQQC
ncbi:hypothetical protein G7046_g4899 [Stylonectria norvegica]|nr:hypothetical protein G7046_g4899 [Stylonectria norvegica]